MELYEYAHRHGDVDAMLNLGKFYHKQGDMKKAAELYDDARHAGSVDAMFNLGGLGRI